MLARLYGKERSVKLFEKWVRRIANDEIERYFKAVSEFNRRAESTERRKPKDTKRSAA